MTNGSVNQSMELKCESNNMPNMKRKISIRGE
jgi:hypothetical protein